MNKIDELIGEFSNASMDWVKAPRHCPDKVKRYKDARSALRSAFEELERDLSDAQRELSETQETCTCLGKTAENMASQLAAEREAHRWIPIDEQMPEEHSTVLTLTKYIEVLSYHDCEWWLSLYGITCAPDYWQPLPPAPEVKDVQE